MHRWGSNSVSKQLGAEWAVNTLIHVVQELSVLVVFTCVNTSSINVRSKEHAVVFTNRGLQSGILNSHGFVMVMQQHYATAMCKNYKYKP